MYPRSRPTVKPLSREEASLSAMGATASRSLMSCTSRALDVYIALAMLVAEAEEPRR